MSATLPAPTPGEAVCACGHFEQDHDAREEYPCAGHENCWCEAFSLAGMQPLLLKDRAAATEG